MHTKGGGKNAEHVDTNYIISLGSVLTYLHTSYYLWKLHFWSYTLHMYQQGLYTHPMNIDISWVDIYIRATPSHSSIVLHIRHCDLCSSILFLAVLSRSHQTGHKSWLSGLQDKQKAAQTSCDG